MPMNSSQRLLLAAGLGLFGAVGAHAQAAVEYGAAASGMGASAGAAKHAHPASKTPAAAANTTSPHMAPTNPEAAAAANRADFEKLAGPGAAPVAFRSVPDHAQVWVDTQYVGTTPFDLKLAPGHHQVRMNAMDAAPDEQPVELAAKQARQISFTLKPLYPNQVSVHWASHN